MKIRITKVSLAKLSYSEWNVVCFLLSQAWPRTRSANATVSYVENAFLSLACSAWPSGGSTGSNGTRNTPGKTARAAALFRHIEAGDALGLDLAWFRGARARLLYSWRSSSGDSAEPERPLDSDGAAFHGRACRSLSYSAAARRVISRSGDAATIPARKLSVPRESILPLTFVLTKLWSAPRDN